MKAKDSFQSSFHFAPTVTFTKNIRQSYGDQRKLDQSVNGAQLRLGIFGRGGAGSRQRQGCPWFLSSQRLSGLLP